MRKSRPRNDPSTETTNTVRSIDRVPGATFMMYRAGSVKIEPDTTRPDAPPMLCTMTFSRIEFLRTNSPETPTARMLIGIAASITCAILSPE